MKNGPRIRSRIAADLRANGSALAVLLALSEKFQADTLENPVIHKQIETFIIYVCIVTNIMMLLISKANYYRYK